MDLFKAFFQVFWNKKTKKILELYKYVRKVDYRYQKIPINFKVATLQIKKFFLGTKYFFCL